MGFMTIPLAINPYLFSGRKKPPTPTPAPSVSPATPAPAAIVKEEEKKKVRRGMPKRTTILTSPLGLSGGAKPGLKTLLGE